MSVRGQIVSVTIENPKKKRNFFWYVRQVIKLVLLLTFVACCTVAFKLYQKYAPVVRGYYAEACKIAETSKPSDFRTEQTSFIYDGEGKQLVKLKLDKDTTYVEYDKIPKDAVNAVVSIEDKRFWEHQGVDWKSTAKAAALLVVNKGDIVRGGSTITQQLVKNTYLTREQSIERKIKEIFIALKLEEKYSKQQILEYYLNNINYANGYYGIGAAAKGYFNKNVSDLSANEIAFLSAIPNNPSLYDPLERLNNTIKRRNVILYEMWSQGYLNKKDYLINSNSAIHFYKKKHNNYNYLTSYAIDCAVKAIMTHNKFHFRYEFNNDKDFRKYRRRYLEEYEECKTELYTGGYKVYTSLDRSVQKQAQKILNSTLKGFTSKSKDGIYEMQGAATVIDNKTGHVIALIGGRSQNFHNVITLNRAYQSFRQPGSTIKPLIVYTPAFEAGYTPETKVNDVYSQDGPHNSGNSYSGWIPLREAVIRSKNVIAWNLFNEIGPKKGLSFAQNMQFSKIVPSDYYLASALGGLTYGTTTVEMASGYRTLANDGVYNDPTCITRIKTSGGLTLPFSRPNKRVYSTDAARTMTDVLQGVVHGTAKGLSLPKKMPIACKTGTTNNQTNGWFCGYTPYYTVACYVGYDESKSVGELWGSTYPMQVWKGIQTIVNNGKKRIPFKKRIIVKKVEKSTNSNDSFSANENDYSDSTVNTEEDTEQTQKVTTPSRTKTPVEEPRVVEDSEPVKKNTKPSSSKNSNSNKVVEDKNDSDTIVIDDSSDDSVKDDSSSDTPSDDSSTDDSDDSVVVD